MLLTYARAFATCTAAIEYARGQLAALMAQGSVEPVTSGNVAGQSAELALIEARDLCGNIPSLQKVVAQIDRTSQTIARGDIPLILYQELGQLNLRLLDELQDHYYYPITKAYADTYYNETPFGEEVYNNFPSARLDIQNAGKCIILGQGTAGVFHLMRVMEVALKVIGRDLGIPYAPSWEAYIRQIDAKISEKHAQKAPAWKRKEPFYKEVLGDLVAVKVAWRNPTMHIVNEYGTEKATTIYNAVMALMQRLADKGLKERGRPVAVSVALASETP